MRVIVDDAGPHKEVFELPIDALREAMINALSHRDYYESGATIVVAVYDDRVEISNPGGLLPQVAENFGHKSLSRNPFIFSLFTRMQLVEKVGSGIPRMIGLMKEFGLNEPIFSKDGIFSISFPKTIGKFVDATTEKNDSNDNVGVNVGINVGINEQQLLDLIAKEPTITAHKAANILNMSTRQMERLFASLKNKGIIAREGSDKNGTWVINMSV